MLSVMMHEERTGDRHDPAAWSGVFPAALTMFGPDGAFDERGTSEHIDWLVNTGANGIVVGGTSGEFISLRDDERRRLITTAVEAAAGRVPVVAGTGYYSTQDSIALTRFAEEAGADGALIVLPYYQRPTKREVANHYRRVASVTSLPLMAYNIPANSAAPGLTVSDLAELHAERVISSVKLTPSTLREVAALRQIAPASFRVFCGGATAPTSELLVGADGWISGILNVTASEAAAMFTSIRKLDMATYKARLAEVMLVFRAVTGELADCASDLAIYRGVLRLKGRCSGHCRPPLVDLTVEQMRVLEVGLSGDART